MNLPCLPAPHLCHDLGEELYQHRDHSSVIILIIQQTHRSEAMGGEDRLRVTVEG